MALIADVRIIIARDLSALQEEIRSTPDELIWVSANGVINSVGTLAYHICGNLNHFIGHLLGNSDFIRDRDAEFNNFDLTKQELIDYIEFTKKTITESLNNLTEEKLENEMPSPPPRHQGRSIGFFLVQLCCHMSRHRGQLDYLRRIKIAEVK